MTFVMALFLSISLTTLAGAAVLTFEGLTLDSQISDGYGGFTWNNMYVLSGTNYVNSGYYNGVISPNNVAYNAYAQTAYVTSVVDFDFNGAYFTGAWNDGLNINVLGFNNGIQLYDSTIIVSAFTSMFYNLSFQGVDELRFTSFGGTDVPNFSGDGAHFAMDNFTYNDVSAVPEPSTVLLLGAGLLGAAMVGRRKRV